jgi:hypothetical protein
MLAASGACFCFVVGVYGNIARIYRFDRARAVISPSFNLRSTDVLLRFLWRIVHPKICHLADGTMPRMPTLLGVDTTVTTLTTEEETWLQDKLINIHNYDRRKMAKTRVVQSKKMLAMYRPLDSDTNIAPSPKWCYSIGEPLSHSSGLFSRATKVLKVLFQEDPTSSRRSEIELYNHIRKCYPSNYPSGVAQALGAIDFSTLPESNGHKTDSFESHTVKLDASSDDKYDTQPYIPDPDLHRSHTRMTMYPVGEEITSFNCTRDLVEAIRDAIEGTLLEYCRLFFSLLINERT